jgi:2-dehydropantoate 2-reductase
VHRLYGSRQFGQFIVSRRSMENVVRIQVIGGGAIGTFLAASFAIAGNDTTVIARGARADLLRENGLIIRREEKLDRVLIEVQQNCENVPKPEIVFLCTKAYDLEGATDLLSVYADDPPIMVTLQNGVDAPRYVADRLPEACVIAARMHGFFVLEDAVVQHVGVDPSIHFGNWQNGEESALALLEKLLASTGIVHKRSYDIKAELWEKMLLASAVGSVASALAVPVGKIRALPHARNLLKNVMDEIAYLANAHGIKLPKDCVDQNLRFVDCFPEHATSSLQRDLEARRPSEFNHLTGAVLRMANAIALHLPANRNVKDMIEARGLITRELNH